MSAESELYTALKAVSAITAIVGTGDSARIYPVVLPDGIEAPSIVYQRTGTEYTNTIGGLAAASKVTFDLFCVAKEFDDAESLCDLVVAVLPANPYEKVSRSQTYDMDAEMFGAVLTVATWPA